MSGAIALTVTEVAGERIACLESSGTGPPIVLLHSNSTSSELYHPLLEGPLGARYRAIAVDFPGHGRSSKSTRGMNAYSLPALARLLPALVTRWGLDRYVLVGHSLGAHAMLEALDALPGALGALSISAPPIRIAELARAFQPDPTEGLLFRDVLAPLEVERFARALVRPGVLSRAREQAIEQAISAADPAFRRTLGASLRAGLLGDEVAAVTRSRVPLAFVHGTEDPFIFQAAYSAINPPNRWREGVFAMRGQGHSPHLSAPAEFEALLGAFVRDVTEVL